MNLYETLGVKSTASKKEIEKAYRAKAMKEHPDHGGDTESFKEITLAYSVLKDSSRRERYDTTGQTDSATSLRDQLFRSLLVEGFTRSDHPIASIIKKLTKDLRELEMNRSNLKSQKETISRRLKKFLEKNDNLLVQETIEATIASLDKNIESFTETLDLTNALIKDFKEFKEDSQQEKSYNYTSVSMDAELLEKLMKSFGGFK